MKTTNYITVLIIAALCTTLTPRFSAAEEKKVDVKIPDTAAALWSEIDAKQKAYSDAVTAKKSEGLEELGETLEALVVAIPSKYADLAPDKKKRVEGQVKNVARLCDAIHEGGEQGKWEDAAKKTGQVDAALKLIKQQIGK